MFGLTDLCIQAEPSTNIMVTFESDDAMPQCLLLCVFMLYRFHYQLCWAFDSRQITWSFDTNYAVIS